jgi:outer membrane lipoprotein-sorting protein
MRTQTRVSPRPAGMACSFALAFAISLPVAAQSPVGVNEVFARMDKTAQQFKAVTASIKRDVHTAVINDDAKDEGTIKVKRDKSNDTRMLIEFTGPDAKTVSLSGTNVSVYLPKAKTGQVYDVGSKKSLVDQFLLLGFGASSTDLKEHYDVTLVGTEKVGTDNTWHLQLVPKSADVLKNLKQAELWISENTGLPAQQRFVTSSTGDFTLVTFSNMKLNPPLDDNALKLTFPKGVTVEHPRL